ncbi:MAG TPA: class III extradiol ring-cleavage dioxygenase [Steroidobacteraceae bacterium]
MSEHTNRLPTLYIPHGGGPCFFMEVPPGLPPDVWEPMAAYLKGLDASIGTRPKSVLVISGHWETPRPTVNTAEHPALLFDYYGFPPHTYQLTYPAAGSPHLAARVRELLTAAQIPSDQDSSRGLDHGVFVPFKLIYPDADIPMVQLSMNQNLDAVTHLRMGRALAPLRDEGVLIVGSGMSYHNLRNFFSSAPQAVESAEQFGRWLNDAVTDSDPAARDRKLTEWFAAPGARGCHPRPEHLIPLMVAAGAAGADLGKRTFHDRLLGKSVAGFQFG